MHDVNSKQYGIDAFMYRLCIDYYDNLYRKQCYRYRIDVDYASGKLCGTKHWLSHLIAII